MFCCAHVSVCFRVVGGFLCATPYLELFGILVFSVFLVVSVFRVFCVFVCYS